MKELLLLTPEDSELNSPTKILDKNLQKIKSFDAGYKFYFETVEYSDFHKIMKSVLKLDYCFMVLGELTEYGQSLEEAGKSGTRRKKKGTPTIQDRQGNEIVLDLDDHILDGFIATDPEPAIKKWLKKRKINCDVTWQITSSQQLNTEEARIRLYMVADKQYDLKTRKAWSQSPDIMADGSVYTCSQPIYIAPPVIQKGKDPIKKRSGFIKGKLRKIKIPVLTPAEVENYSSFSRGGEAYDYNDPTLPEEVLDGSVYRRYFMPLAFHYANLLKSDREAIFAIISAKARMVDSREFHPDNVFAFIDDAIAKVESEQAEKEIILDDVATAKDFEERYENEVPEFPEDLLQNFPEPWPMLYDNFSRVPRELHEELLIPTILSLNAFFLKTSYVTEYQRRPNMFFLNLAPSTAGKDVNSTNVIREMGWIFKKRGCVGSMFAGIVSTESAITADTTFLQSFNEAEEFFWVNTESTRIFQQIKGGGGNSNVAALSDKLIEVVDGHEIRGKVKTAGRVKTIENPNCQVLFYAQPETIEQYIDDSMVDSGLFGRSLLSIMPDLPLRDDLDLFGEKPQGDYMGDVDDEFYEFYTSSKFNPLGKEHKKVLKLDKKQKRLLNEWANEKIGPLIQEDDTYSKVLTRIGNAGEQLYVIVLGICQIYDAHMETEIRDKISVASLIPLLEYWVDTKVYAIKNLVSREQDPLAAGIIDIAQRLLTGDLTAQHVLDKLFMDKHHAVPFTSFMRAIRNRKQLTRKLQADGDSRNIEERIGKLLKVLESSGDLQVTMITWKGRDKKAIRLLK